ncbi:MAG: GNAT family N-acetyltransferase [Nocardioidaceae bacterium]|nr:GNAT family N-acetyltransferase [Nocardioidaceae bacterium]
MVEIRTATTDDLDAVGRVHAASRAAAYAGLVPPDALARVTPATQAEVWRQRMAASPAPSALLVAIEGGELVGFTHGTGREERAELDAIHLAPDRLGSGVGQALHDALLDEFVGWGCVRAELWVLRGNERAQAFYRRNGWAHDGRTSEHDVGGAVVPILGYARRL